MNTAQNKRPGCLLTTCVVLAVGVVVTQFLPPLNLGGCAVSLSRYKGRVVDQHGDPVVGAKVKGSWTPVPLGNPTEHHTTTDEDGKFSFSGAFGIQLYVSASKEGYYVMYGTGDEPSSADGIHWKMPGEVLSDNKSKPLTLLKAGTIEPLVRVRERDVRIPRDGSAVVLSLEPEKNNSPHVIEVRCWTRDQQRQSNGPYD